MKLSVAHQQGEGIGELVHLRENILVHVNERGLLQMEIERHLLRLSRFCHQLRQLCCKRRGSHDELAII